MIKQLFRFGYHRILYFLSLIWSGIHILWRLAYRYDLFKKNSFQVPIISVGNITFGGTGKTPFVIWLANFLKEQDKKVMISMRGYQSKKEHFYGFLRAGRKMSANPVEYGDEALLLSKKLNHVSIVVGKNRSDNLDYCFDRESPDVVLLDDGHQHLKMERDLNIVLFDATMPLEKYQVAPLGYMRESFYALQDADVIVISKVDQAHLKKLEQLEQLIRKYCLPDVVLAQIAYKPMGIHSLQREEQIELSKLKGKDVICVAGIASTSSFYSMIETLGVNIVKRYSFPDHYFFNNNEIEILLEEAEASNCHIVMTEKDAVKIHRFFHDRIYYLKIDIEFVNGEKNVQEAITRIA